MIHASGTAAALHATVAIGIEICMVIYATSCMGQDIEVVFLCMSMHISHNGYNVSVFM